MKYRTAIIHDYLNKIGGAEMTLVEIAKLWPEAPIYTLLSDPKIFKVNEIMLQNKIKESFLNRFKIFRKKTKLALPFLSVVPETFDLRNYDVVISSSGAFSKGVITKPNTLNICYCHSPMRFAWDYTHRYLNDIKISKPLKLLSRLALNYVRIWDTVSSDRVDFFIANSHATKRKIKKYYNRDSKVIYPPVDTKKISNYSKKTNQEKDFFLIVSRLSNYKKIDIAIEAFNKLGWELVIIGSGNQKPLEKIAGPNVKILGLKTRKEIIDYYSKCKAYVQVCEEDFGISAVEAMAAGKPVLALKQGGALETVIEGKTGEFFLSEKPEILAEGASRINENYPKYDPETIMNHAKQFSKERFRDQMKNYIELKWNKYKKNDQ